VAGVLSLFLLPAASFARALRVGPGKTYSTVRAASQAALNGDSVLVDAGTYNDDVTEWTANNLVIRGVGGRAYMRSSGVVEQDKGIWLFYGTNLTVENIEFSGATSSGLNGAGIRFDTPGKLILRNCYFHDNEDGILGGADSLLIENSIFDHNGYGDGQSHNMYIHGRTFTLRYSYTHRASLGHNVKTRCLNNYILFNRIMDEADGTASYSIDIPDCGRSYIIGNIIEQGPNTSNSSMIRYGAESQLNGVLDLYVVNNTLVNNLGSGTFVRLRDGTTAKVLNNIFYGAGTNWSGVATVTASNNYYETSFNNSPKFANPGSYDFRLTAGSPLSIVNAAMAPGISATGYLLTPTSQYVYDALGTTRSLLGLLDIGAFEYGAGGGPDVVSPAAVRDLRYR